MRGARFVAAAAGRGAAAGLRQRGAAHDGRAPLHRIRVQHGDLVCELAAAHAAATRIGWSVRQAPPTFLDHLRLRRGTRVAGACHCTAAVCITVSSLSSLPARMPLRSASWLLSQARAKAG